MTQQSGAPKRMRLGEILHLVWINIMESKFKVVLTSLGIIVGSATIVLVIAVGHGGEVDVQNQFKNLNAGSISVSVSTEADLRDQMMQGLERAFGGQTGGSGGQAFGGNGGTAGGNRTAGGTGRTAGGTAGGMAGGAAGGFMGGGSFSGGQSVTLSTTDVDDIASFVPGLSDVSILSSGNASVEGGDLEDETDYTVVGVLPDYQSISNLELLQGDFISEDDQDTKNKIAVIGYGLAQDIFGSAYAAYGENLSIEGKKYEIVGVLASMGSVTTGVSPDDSIFIPYSTALKYVFGNQAKPQIMAIASDVGEVPQAMENIQAVLTEDHPKASFTIADAGSSMEAATTSANTLSMLLMAVACIVFVVGGIGIMNVLFVSVKERTQEIGILKALGCSKREILLEFLFEANLISVFGGIVGVGMGFALTPLVRMTGMTVEPLAVSGFYSMAFAVVTGTLFGFYPAGKAAALMPIEALSQE